jgi:hypothetical protein
MSSNSVFESTIRFELQEKGRKQLKAAPSSTAPRGRVPPYR